MRCPECGFNNPDDMRFCTNCGTKLEATAPPRAPTTSAKSCPQCGAQVRPEARFCDQCGASLTVACPQCGADATPGERFCSQCGQDLEQATTPAASATPQVERASPLPNVIAAGVGAVMMLVSLAVPWYTIRLWGSSEDWEASFLMDPGCIQECPLWAGFGLPVVLVIIFASLVLISAIYSFAAKAATRALWASLGSLCAFCVAGNALYILWWLHENTYPAEWINIVQAGSALAFAGALVVALSGAIGRWRTEVSI